MKNLVAANAFILAFGLSFADAQYPPPPSAERSTIHARLPEPEPEPLREERLRADRLQTENGRLRTDNDRLTDENAALKTAKERLERKHAYQLGGVGIGELFNRSDGKFFVDANLKFLYATYIAGIGGGGGLLLSVPAWRFNFRILNAGVIAYHGSPLTAAGMKQYYAINFGAGVDFRFWPIPTGKLLNGLAAAFRVQWYLPDLGAAYASSKGRIDSDAFGTIYANAINSPFFSLGLRLLF